MKKGGSQKNVTNRTQRPSGNKQVNQYDKVLREIAEDVLPGLLKDLLGLDIVDMEELPDDIQHTKERKPDILKKVTDKNNRTSILQVEWQVTNEEEMAFRMAEYYIMLSRRYQLPVQQYVIYMGEGISRMPDQLHSEQLHFKYPLFNLSAIDYRLLLSKQHPREKMLAILGNFGSSDRQQVVETIIKEVIATSEGDFSKERHLKQMLILGNLRNLQPEIKTIMESVAKWFKIERDPLYQIGQEKGMEKEKKQRPLRSSNLYCSIPTTLSLK
ncbi:MAG TPA: hypothetical protein VI233_17695 [Puia sp.]